MSAWTRIAHTELGSTQATIEFTSIAQTYTDLLLVVSLRSDRNVNTFYTNAKISINNSTTGYSIRELIGQFDGTSNVAESRSDLTDSVWPFKCPSTAQTASTFGNTLFYFPNYAGSTAKSVSVDYTSENNAQSTVSWINAILAGLNTSTSAISSIQIGIRALDGATGFVSGSSATLYGILKGSSGGVTVS